MACGTPVVAARTGALEEVSGERAVLVDPLDPDAIAAASTRRSTGARTERGSTGELRLARRRRETGGTERR
jgi:glycosyltransferase involved in cell wall biosynthesis